MSCDSQLKWSTSRTAEHAEPQVPVSICISRREFSTPGLISWSYKLLRLIIGTGTCTRCSDIERGIIEPTVIPAHLRDSSHTEARSNSLPCSAPAASPQNHGQEHGQSGRRTLYIFLKFERRVLCRCNLASTGLPVSCPENMTLFTIADISRSWTKWRV